MEKKLSFLNFDRPPLVDMIIVETPTQAVNNIRNAIYDGADAFGMQMERLRPEFRTEEILKKLITIVYTELSLVSEVSMDEISLILLGELPF